MPAKTGGKTPASQSWKDYLRFASISFTAFLILTLGSAYVQGRDLIDQSGQAAHAGYDNIKEGVNFLLSQDAEMAQVAFSEAEKAFDELSVSTRYLTGQANTLMGESLFLDTANGLIEAALEVAQIGQSLASLMDRFKTLPQQVLSASQSGDVDVIGLVNQEQIAFRQLLASAANLQRKITSLNLGLLPVDLQEKLGVAQEQMGTFIAALLQTEGYFSLLYDILGDEVPHRYLILFQNNHELRATGGFIGSYMLVDVNDGRITKMEAKDVYENDGQLQEFVKAPAGINQVAERLYMRDANYSPDFPTSAKEIMWFLENSKGPSVDTVIAIDQTLIEELLSLTGPIVLPSFPYQIKSSNFNDIISYHTEAKIHKGSTPKQLLFDLIPSFKSKLSNLDDPQTALPILLKMIDEGHVQVYSNYQRIQDFSQEWGLSGKMLAPESKTDYLSVVTTSIGGNKSDAYIDTSLEHDTQISAKGEIKNSLVIKKTHTWGQAEETKMANMFERFGTGKLTKEALYFILGRGPNVDYMRVYVPLGSQLTSSTGINLEDVHVSQELGYTVFGFTNGPVNAGDSNQISLEYALPFKLSLSAIDNYKFLAENQAGAENIHLKKTLGIADSLRVEKSYPTSAFSLVPTLESDFTQPEIYITAITKK